MNNAIEKRMIIDTCTLIDFIEKTIFTEKIRNKFKFFITCGGNENVFVIASEKFKEELLNEKYELNLLEHLFYLTSEANSIGLFIEDDEKNKILQGEIEKFILDNKISPKKGDPYLIYVSFKYNVDLIWTHDDGFKNRINDNFKKYFKVNWLPLVKSKDQIINEIKKCNESKKIEICKRDFYDCFCKYFN